MKDIVEYIAKAIVSHPDEVVVTEEEEDDGLIILRLEVAPSDKGKVIGRQGRVGTVQCAHCFRVRRGQRPH